MSCRAQCHGVELPFAKVPRGICTEDCFFLRFGCHVARHAAASLASFVQLSYDDLYRISCTSPLQCTVLPVTSGVL